MDSTLVDRYRNRWVAVDDDGEVVADDESFERLHELLASMTPVHVLIRRVPAVDEPMFVGIW